MKLKVLFVEDSADDTQAMLRRLGDDGLEVEWERAADEAGLRKALAVERWQVALVDYNIPGYSGLEALRLIAELAPDVPAITISGGIDEETAVASITAGAVDYVLKENLRRLATAVRRAVEGAALRRSHRRAARRAELALFTLDNASVAIVVLIEDGSVVYANEAACAMLGSPHERVMGARVWELYPRAGLARWGHMWQEVRSRGRLEREVALTVPSGKMILHVSAGHLEREDGEFLVAYARDITERRRAEEAARESREMYERIVENASEGVWVADADYTLTFANEQMATMLGYGQDEIVGCCLDRFVHPDDLGEHVRQKVRRRGLRNDHYERRFLRKDGSVVWAMVSSTALLAADGGFAGSFGLLTDVTQLRTTADEARRTAERLQRTLEGSVLAMSSVVETRDPYTAGHERRVAELATAIAIELGWGGPELEGLRLAALIHDIGKIAVPAEILAKPGRLSRVELDLVEQHSRAGHDILRTIEFDRPIAEMVLQHHERLDGSGYPGGLSGEQILPEARVLAVADVVEAMSSHRPYRPALGTDAALGEVRAGSGTRYDADVAAACRRVVEERGFTFTS